MCSLARRVFLPPAVLAAIFSLSALSVTPTVLAVEAKAGWSSGLDVNVEGSAGLCGGASRGQALHSLAVAKVDWIQAENADRGVHFRTYASVMNLTGRGPSDRFLGDFLAASNSAGFNSTRLYSWWVEAQMGNWSLRAGALLADDEFTGTEIGANLFNSAFGWPAFISANTVNTGPAFFVAAPGVRIERKLGETAAWRLGVYDGDTFDSKVGDPVLNRLGLHYRVGGDQGWFAMTEATFAPKESANRYKAGAWLHTAKFSDVRDDTTGRRLAITGGTPRSHSGNLGAYSAIERTLAGKSGEAGYFAGFVRGGIAPANRNTLTWALDTGLAYTGLIPGRANDTTTLGLAHGNFSSRFAANAYAIDPSSAKPDFEQALELSHSVMLTERITVQPDLQYIRHPGGSTAQRDALAFLLRVKATY